MCTQTWIVGKVLIGIWHVQWLSYLLALHPCRFSNGLCFCIMCHHTGIENLLWTSIRYNMYIVHSVHILLFLEFFFFILICNMITWEGWRKNFKLLVSVHMVSRFHWTSAAIICSHIYEIPSFSVLDIHEYCRHRFALHL